MKTLAARFRRHAAMMPAGLYRTLMLAAADDWEAGGVVADICRDWTDAPTSSVIQLRLLAGLHRLVLSGRAPELVRYYPNLGGDAAPDQAWADVRPVLAAHVEELRAALAIAPQTNEPGRAVPLLVGLFDAVRRSGLAEVRLLEVGASAGLNLLVDRFYIAGQQDPDGRPWSAGPADSPLRLTDAVVGAVRPVDYTVVDRRGCDLAPIDPATPDGRLRLVSFVWPHDQHRHDRLRAALAVAADRPAPVDRAAAGDWLAGQLAGPPATGVLTVVWHSVTRQYWPLAEAARVDELIAEAGRRMPIAQVAMESPILSLDPASDLRGYQPPRLTVRLAMPGGPADAEPVVLGIAHDHGVPVTLRQLA